MEVGQGEQTPRDGRCDGRERRQKARPREGREGPRERSCEPESGTCPKTLTGTSEQAQVSCLLTPRRQPIPRKV